MTDLSDIYQEVILDHYRKPRNFAVMEAPTREARGHNPLCGDRINVYLEVDEGIVKNASFQGAGCAISTASASMMTETVKGKSVEEATALFHQFHDRMTSDEVNTPHDLGKLEALSGVRRIPIRVKCATLAWHTLKAALDQHGDAKAISTE